MKRIILGVFVAIFSFTFSTSNTLADSACEKKTGDIAIQSCTKFITTKTYLGKPISNHNLSVMYENRGLQYFKKEQYDEALSDFESALRAIPKNVKASNNLDSVYVRLKKYDLAIASLNQALKLAPDYALALSNRGVAYRNKGQLDKALEDFNAALISDPRSDYDYLQRAEVHKRMKNYRKAIADYNTSLELRPNVSTTYYNRGISHYLMGQHQDAYNDFSKALELDLTSKDAANNKKAILKIIEKSKK